MRVPEGAGVQVGPVSGTGVGVSSSAAAVAVADGAVVGGASGGAVGIGVSSKQAVNGKDSKRTAASANRVGGDRRVLGRAWIPTKTLLS
jgi:hypothetical protein